MSIIKSMINRNKKAIYIIPIINKTPNANYNRVLYNSVFDFEYIQNLINDTTNKKVHLIVWGAMLDYNDYNFFYNLGVSLSYAIKRPKKLIVHMTPFQVEAMKIHAEQDNSIHDMDSFDICKDKNNTFIMCSGNEAYKYHHDGINNNIICEVIKRHDKEQER